MIKLTCTIMVIFIVLLAGKSANAQTNITNKKETSELSNISPATLQEDTTQKEHSPKKAARLSALLPGLGQFYNEKYWKIPVVYAALGTATYFIINNNKEYQKYKNAYIARKDSTKVTPLKFSTENIRLRREYYRRNLELSIMATAGIYVLNIVDAAVDAHLFYFNVSKDLSMRIEPQANAFMPNSNGGLKISLHF